MEKIVVVLVFWCSINIGIASAQLQVGFYNSRCPKAESIIRGVVQQRFNRDRSITPALLRMHFHDCFVRGCDASILIDSKSKSAEKDAGPNLTVRGFDLIDAAKKAVEAACASTVSCADIITLATRDAVALAGGPNYAVPTGRRDGLVSNINDVSLPGPQESVAQAFSEFRRKGLTLNDMVTLLGAHTVGVAHCSFFQDRLSNFQGSGKPDPTMDPGLAARLLRICGTGNDPTAFLDQGTSFTVDNQFYNQTVFKRGILQIDQELALDRSSRPIVSAFASNKAAFPPSFAAALIKMGKIQVLVGSAGEIRKNCRAFNPKRTPRLN
ncbi:Peroxidase superfamily protein [Perilla frutescens var. hirtella]|uniref:Peroxidase n=1 Tax=Perilla frutescens var. hirtella TaxID=608512 RepID=A0AAD4IT77_PERFH|nr:Peroxidase superfamily protein [Perilla frutescens var. hirtella]KAH6817558.1 Peroxidase superfamily protein [Perilla frutescens var. frutescens]KAH6820834.1 Peroxidase superfamily protein [Perilla frutescens var. hirtella]